LARSSPPSSSLARYPSCLCCAGTADQSRRAATDRTAYGCIGNVYGSRQHLRDVLVSGGHGRSSQRHRRRWRDFHGRGNATTTPVALHIEAFLRENLSHHRGVSQHTCDSYACSFQLLFEFAATKLRTKPSSLSLEQIDSQLYRSRKLVRAWCPISSERKSRRCWMPLIQRPMMVSGTERCCIWRFVPDCECLS
jgi:hypothetical protein